MPKARGERWYDNLTVDDSLHDAVQGNADRTASREVLQVLRGQTHTRDLFCIRIARRVRVTHVNVVPNPSEPSRSSGQVLCEILVEEDMVDEHGNVAVGCLTFLVDLLTTLALVAQGAHVKRTGDYVGVSQAMQFVFHAPAPLGTTLRIDNICVAIGGRTLSARCEVWDVGADRLVCSAFHTKMPPSPAKL